MADGIMAGGEGVFQAVEQLNGGSFGPQPQFTWAVDVEDVTVVPASNNPGRAVVSIPADEQATEVTVTASTVDPDGKALSKSVSVPVLPRVYDIDLQKIV